MSIMIVMNIEKLLLIINNLTTNSQYKRSHHPRSQSISKIQELRVTLYKIQNSNKIESPYSMNLYSMKAKISNL